MDKLPPELLDPILWVAMANSPCDFVCLSATCRRFREAVGSRRFKRKLVLHDYFLPARMIYMTRALEIPAVLNEESEYPTTHLSDETAVKELLAAIESPTELSLHDSKRILKIMNQLHNIWSAALIIHRKRSSPGRYDSTNFVRDSTAFTATILSNRFRTRRVWQYDGGFTHDWISRLWPVPAGTFMIRHWIENLIIWVVMKALGVSEQMIDWQVGEILYGASFHHVWRFVAKSSFTRRVQILESYGSLNKFLRASPIDYSDLVESPNGSSPSSHS